MIGKRHIMTDCSENLNAKIKNHVPPLEELKNVIGKGLSNNFEKVAVEIRVCPDMTQHPFYQTSTGFGDDMAIAEVGGPANLFPIPLKDKQFDLKRIAKVCERDEAYIFGPGAGPWDTVGCNCEMIVNANISEDEFNSVTIRNSSRSTGFISEFVDSHKFNLMANLALSTSNIQREVVYFKCEVRTGTATVTQCIREALEEFYEKKLVSLAGFFVIDKSKTRVHIMPDFPKGRFGTNVSMNDWLKFYDLKSPLVGATVIHSHDADRNLRLEHTHCFSEQGEGGHYHYDLAPETVIYEGYLAPSEEVYRIDEVETMPPDSD